MNQRHAILSAAIAGAIMFCAAPVFAAGGMQQAPADNNSEQPVTDTWITTKVKADLAVTDGVKSTDISVTTVDGVVTLSGVLASETGREKAIAVAKGIKGVKRVDASGLKAS